MNKGGDMKKIAFLITFALLAGMGCGGGSGGSAATQYTLDVQGAMTIEPTAAAITVGKLNQQQVMIGTTLIEVTSNNAQDLGIKFLNLDAQPQVAADVNFTLTLDPNNISTGTIFKTCELGIPFGTSVLDFYLAVTTDSADVTLQETGTNVLFNDGKGLILGQFRAEAEAGDRTRLPLLGDVPVINFLFKGEQQQATLDSLIIILTPQIIDDTHG